MNLNRSDLGYALERAMSEPGLFDWNRREETAAEIIAEKCRDAETILVGDLLRPALVVHSSKGVWLRARSGVAPSRVVEELVAQMAGQSSDLEYAEASRLPPSFDAHTQPRRRVILTNLVDGARYPRARYPLNIARLAQWLRFTTLARVDAYDSLLDFGSELELQAAALAAAGADMVGVSVNFGELERFGRLLEGFRRASYEPLIIVGNIAALYAAEAIRELATGFDIRFARSYGEHMLTDIVLGEPSVERRVATNLMAPPPHLLAPDVLVFPDERLAASTADRGGQLSLETSFGCQFSKCTFCPREHKGDAWVQAASGPESVLEELCTRLAYRNGPALQRTISIVDEEIFGSEGLDEEAEEAPLAVKLAEVASGHGQLLEVYTRLEQIYSTRRSPGWNLRRLGYLKRIRPALQRVFVGVESGNDAQLRRYGKGQDIATMVPALRAGSMLGLPLEFGFITFDPLSSLDELIDSINFLARRDVMIPTDEQLTPKQVVDRVTAGSLVGDPIFTRVAYLATELEVLEGSRYLAMIRKHHPDLVGGYDPGFLRYHVSYRDSRVDRVASVCRVWTEGTFASMYRLRLSLRSGAVDGSRSGATSVLRHRYATFLLLALAVGEVAGIQVSDLVEAAFGSLEVPAVGSLDDDSLRETLDELWAWVRDTESLSEETKAEFDLATLAQRRDA